MNKITNTVTKDFYNGIYLNNKTPKGIISLTIKVLIFLVPGILLGHYIDQYINKLKKQEVFGKNIVNYVMIQTVISIFIVYCLVNWAKSYTKEIENKIAGVFFASLYFNMQNHYIENIQQTLGFL
jgi:uncharacterized membrane protein YraQ (UPF0718 family)